MPVTTTKAEMPGLSNSLKSATRDGADDRDTTRSAMAAMDVGDVFTVRENGKV